MRIKNIKKIIVAKNILQQFSIICIIGRQQSYSCLPRSSECILLIVTLRLLSASSSEQWYLALRAEEKLQTDVRAPGLQFLPDE